LPDDIDDEKYISIPDKSELDVGKPLVLDFVREFLPDDYDEVRPTSVLIHLGRTSLSTAPLPRGSGRPPPPILVARALRRGPALDPLPGIGRAVRALAEGRTALSRRCR
jgi:hypothetical protein